MRAFLAFQKSCRLLWIAQTGLHRRSNNTRALSNCSLGRRILRCPRRCLAQVGENVCLCVSSRPLSATQEHVLKNGVGPNVFAMSHVGVKDATAPIRTSPCSRVGRTLVHVALHPLSVLNQN